MSIYETPALYARKVRITERLARIWCNHQLKLQADVELASICPKCGKPTLESEMGCYEEGTEAYVYCSNDTIPYEDEDDATIQLGECDYVSDVREEHVPLSNWYTFDHLLAMHSGIMGEVSDYGGLIEWFTSAKKDIEEVVVHSPPEEIPLDQQESCVDPGYE